MALLRYPGSKERLAKTIIPYIPIDSLTSYCEPFFGSGAIGLRILEKLNPDTPVWINDIDYGVSCLWYSVVYNPQELCEYIVRFRPSVDEFIKLREASLSETETDVVRCGFGKLALHRISYSGLGSKSGSPLGGWNQTSKYKIDCRWNPVNLCKDVWKLHSLLSKFSSLKITRGDYKPTIAPDYFYYLDPPYYEQGNGLYQHGMSDDEHIELATILKSIDNKWVLSYDSHPFISDLYSSYPGYMLEASYTMTTKAHRHELLFVNT